MFGLNHLKLFKLLYFFSNSSLNINNEKGLDLVQIYKYPL